MKSDNTLNKVVQLLSNQLESLVKQNVVPSSFGQQQRIGIERVLYHNSKFLILDEATSATEEDAEKFVMKTVEGHKGEMPILIIHKVLPIINDNFTSIKLDIQTNIK